MVAEAQVPVMAGEGWLGHVGRFRDDPLQLVVEGLRSGDDIVRLKVAMVQAYVVYGPELVRQVLVEHPERFGRQSRGARLLRRTLGLSTLTAEGDEWRWRRRLVQPSFKREALMALDRPIVAAARALADRLLAAPGPVDVSELTSAIALSIACTALFGGEIAGDGEVVHRALTEVLAEFLRFTTSPIPNLDQTPLPTARRFRSARADLSGVVERIVERRRARAGEPVGDLLDALLQGTRPDGTPLTAADLDAEGVTMLLAGHETTANAMAFTLGLLGQNPAVGRKLRAELAAVCPDRDPGAADLANLPYLDAVVREGMRLFPPAWVVSRSTNEAVEVGGYALPKGAFLFVPVYAVHRHPRYWDDPEGFDPERWLDGRAEVAKKAGAYFPFGLGQRRCVGEHLGMLEARLVLATLARRVRLELVPGQGLTPEVSVTLRPKGGLWMTPRPVT